nr:TetR/AcrR family transcriptional regulator [Marinicella sp. W31]MDC2876121.1 TetR/AcrR family transcriptional regulator [Marinicella sp. W31]
METTNNPRREAILAEAVRVFGRFGYKKTAVQDLADAAGLSKPGLYLHFASKDEIFRAAMEKYLSDALDDVKNLLTQHEVPLDKRVLGAMDSWFGRHLRTFTPEAFDVIAAGDRLSFKEVEGIKQLLMQLFAETFQQAGFDPSDAANRAQVLFLCGLSWKQPGMTPQAFLSAIKPCVQVCCEGASGANGDEIK